MTRDTNLTVDAAEDGRLTVDLRGELWVIPGGGGEARQLTRALRSVRRPRWSPNAHSIVYEATVDGTRGIWSYDFVSGTSRILTAETHLNLQPSWHPSGERVVYASGHAGTGFDLWEVDVPTGLRWRISDYRGDEVAPAWSSDGRDLVFVLNEGNRWSLMLRRYGRKDELLLTSDHPLDAPSFRPDGSLITFVETESGQRTLKMVILSQPRLVRTLIDNEAIALAPVSWPDRQTMIYTAAGQIRQRTFDSWRSRPVAFRATLQTEPVVPDTRKRPVFDWIGEPTGELVIHANRLFDGLSNSYQYDRDIHIRGGRISSVGAHQERSGIIVIDLGDVTVLPGYIDVDARLPTELSNGYGPDLLTMGVTTVVGRHAAADVAALNSLWSEKLVPGPRLLDASAWPLPALPRAEDDVAAAVSTSRSTGLQAGLSLPSQLRELTRAGLTPEQSLRAIGVNAAAALLADPFVGRIAGGASADLVFVDGDPLTNIEDALNVVAIVRNGRFFSVSGLVDRAKHAESVE